MDSRLAIFLMAISAVFAASSVPKCVDADITKIKTHWSQNGGAPKDILKSTDTFRVTMGTNSAVAAAGKCKTISFVEGNKIHIKEDNNTVPASESNGVLTILGVTSYMIQFTKGVMCAYKCSSDGPAVTSTSPADVTLAHTAAATTADITAAKTALSGMGFSVASFNCK